MRYTLKEILDLAQEGGFAVPAFNVYNLETLMGVALAAKETKAPVIIQMYSRLFNTGTGEFMAPVIIDVMNKLKTPVTFHLDHGAGIPECIRAMRFGTTGVMIDASTMPIDENIETTKKVVDMAREAGVAVEGELGHIGSTKDEKWDAYTEVEDAVRYVEETGIDALAIMVGTAHGKYAQAPVLAIDRIKEIHANTRAHLVLHGGSGVGDNQIKAAVNAGIRKINFGTDVCYAFMDGYKALDPYSAPLDVTMSKVAQNVKEFAIGKIKLLGAEQKGE
ncbi:MAG: class II fructose-bisphosphate aldolase [Clostridiales bacterium]|nr:class II fructose-bisphosphate aldolase [Clostridiales bacterium]